MYNEGSGARGSGAPTGSQSSPSGTQGPRPENASLYMCVISTKSGPRIFFYLKKSRGFILWAEEEKA